MSEANALISDWEGVRGMKTGRSERGERWRLPDLRQISSCSRLIGVIVLGFC